jgi:hypothetical protein
MRRRRGVWRQGNGDHADAPIVGSGAGAAARGEWLGGDGGAGVAIALDGVGDAQRLDS